MKVTHIAALCDERGELLKLFPGDCEGAATGPALGELAAYLQEHPVDRTVPDVPSPEVKLFVEQPPAEPTVRWPANRDNVKDGFVPPEYSRPGATGPA